MRLYIYCAFFLLVSFLFVVNIYSENSILINEFLIEPAPQQVEIMNTGTQSADLSGWYIDDNGGSTYYTIPQLSILYPNACMVFSGDFNLNKSSSDIVRLFNTSALPTDSNASLIDSYSYKSSPGSGISYLRFPDGSNNWTTKSASFGLYNETGLSCVISPSPMPFPTFTPTPTNAILPPESPSPTPISYKNIFISEAMVNPLSGEKEWIELFNDNDFSVSLVNWFVDDIENGGSSPKLFSLDIPARSYGAIDFTSSLFNNSGDSVRLLDFNKNLIDDFEYSTTIQGKTLGRISYNSDEFCIQEPSKGNVNNPCINPSPTPQPTPTKIPISTPTKLSSYSSPVRPTNTPVAINRYIDTSNSNTDQGNVLGLSDENIMTDHRRLISSLLFISISYSLLTIFSIFLRMKSSYEKGL